MNWLVSHLRIKGETVLNEEGRGTGGLMAETRHDCCVLRVGVTAGNVWKN